MTCVICKEGDVSAGTATVTLERGSLTLVLKAVPARVCTTCGEEYLHEETATQLLRIAAEAAEAGVQVAVRRYIAA